MDNTNENETPLFGKKPNTEEPVVAPVAATPEEAAPAAPEAKKTSVGLIIGAIITAAGLIAAAVVLVIVLVSRQPNTSSSDKKSDETSETKKKEQKPEKDDDEDKKDDDKDEDQIDNDEDEDSDDKDKDEDEDEDEDKDEDEDEDEDSDVSTSGYKLSVQGKSFEFSKDYVQTVKNALNAGFEMTYQDINYKDHDLTKSNLSDYLNAEMVNATKKYGSAKASIVDANGDTILSINGSKDYNKTDVVQKYSDAQFDTIQYSSTQELTLPNGKKVSCYNTTKQEVFGIYGKAEVSSLNIARYHKDGLNISFHLDDKDTVTAVFIRID